MNLVSRDRRIYLEADVAFEGRCDARSEPAGRIGVDLEVLLDQLDGGLRIVIDEERPGGVKHAVRL